MELTATERETLKALYRQSPDRQSVRSGDLAEALNVSPATISARLKALDDRGLVSHIPYKGARLSPEGLKVAVSALRRHRIVERLLSDMLGYPWDRADKLAVTFEHHLPAEVVERMFTALHRPTTCPHGFPIPDADADELAQLPTLASAEVGDEVEVAVPGDTHPDVVTFLDGIGIRPGTRITIRERHPFEGPVVVSVGDVERVVGMKLARAIYVSSSGKDQR